MLALNPFPHFAEIVYFKAIQEIPAGEFFLLLELIPGGSSLVGFEPRAI